MSTINPDFRALKTALATNSFEGYDFPVKSKGLAREKQTPSCASGKEVYLSLDDILRAKNTVGSPVRYKSYYRCSICGHYHFSRKEEELVAVRMDDRRKSRQSLRLMAAMYSSDRADLEYGLLR